MRAATWMMRNSPASADTTTWTVLNPSAYRVRASRLLLNVIIAPAATSRRRAKSPETFASCLSVRVGFNGIGFAIAMMIDEAAKASNTIVL